MLYTSLYYQKKDERKKLKVCNTLFSRTLGLMFHRKLKSHEGLLLIAAHESRIETSIHSLFVFFPIDVLWLNAQKKVIDKKTVLPFTLLVRPQKAAKYIVELPKNSTRNIPLAAQLNFEGNYLKKENSF